MLLAHFSKAAELLAGIYRMRKSAKALRKAEAQVWVQNRIQEGQRGIIRARLIKMQRSNPLSIPSDLDVASMDDETLAFYGALLVEDGQYPYPSYDQIEGKPSTRELNWRRGPGAEEEFNQAAEAWRLRNGSL